MVLLLIPLLRLADNLDVSHEERIKALSCHMRDGQVVLQLTSPADISLEQWAAERSGRLSARCISRPDRHGERDGNGARTDRVSGLPFLSCCFGRKPAATASRSARGHRRSLRGSGHAALAQRYSAAIAGGGDGETWRPARNRPASPPFHEGPHAEAARKAGPKTTCCSARKRSPS